MNNITPDYYWVHDSNGNLCITHWSQNGQIYIYPCNENGQIFITIGANSYTAVQYDDENDILYQADGTFAFYIYWPTYTFYI